MAVLRPASDNAQKNTAHATEQNRPDVLKRREEWLDGQFDLDPERLVSIDETWAFANMARRNTRAGTSQAVAINRPARGMRKPMLIYRQPKKGQ